jgi:hypothetical protein
MTTLAYITYLALTLFVVLVVGRLLFVNGRFYLVEIFHDERAADIINRLLITGYCLVNTGGAFYSLAGTEEFAELTQVVIYVVENQGKLLLLLGVMHAINLAVLPLLKSFFRETLNPLKKTGQNNNH